MFFIRRFSQKIYILATILFVTGASATTPFSQYGKIQNVQNYANNPFYNNGTAQITTPRIVYATGPALTPNDCMRTVQSIVENVCFQNNNCKTTTLADVRCISRIVYLRRKGESPNVCECYRGEHRPLGLATGKENGVGNTNT